MKKYLILKGPAQGRTLEATDQWADKHVRAGRIELIKEKKSEIENKELKRNVSTKSNKSVRGRAGVAKRS